MSQLQDAIDCEMPVCPGGALSSTDTKQMSLRMLRHLHDGPVQSLALALLQLDRLLDGAGTTDTQLLGNVRTLVCDALRGTRYVLEACGDDATDEPVALMTSLMSLGRRYGALTGQTLHLNCPARISDPPTPVAAAVLQATQELLINACKHAPGARVELALTAVVDGFELTVCDNGPGFDPIAICRRYGLVGGLGLGSMPDRLARVGAVLHLHSRPGAGVQACICWSENGACQIDGPVA